MNTAVKQRLTAKLAETHPFKRAQRLIQIQDQPEKPIPKSGINYPNTKSNFNEIESFLCSTMLFNCKITYMILAPESGHRPMRLFAENTDEIPLKAKINMIVHCGAKV